MSEKIRAKSAAARRSVDAGRRVGSSDTLAELVAERKVNPLRALSVFSWIAAWGIFVEGMGREPRSMAELIATLEMNQRTAYRWQKAFREAFPEYKTPALLWAVVVDQVPVESHDPAVMAMAMGGATV